MLGEFEIKDALFCEEIELVRQVEL